jgi:rhamnulokinase
LGLYHQIKTGLQKVAKETDNNIESIGIDTWGVDYGLLDKTDNLLSNPHHYRDNRTDDLMKELWDKIGKDNIYNQTGIQFMQINTLYQLYAEAKYRPWIINNARSLLFMPDLLNFFLTGEKYNEYTIASTSQFFNPEKNHWTESILEELGVPTDIMQEIISPGTQTGKVTAEIKEECAVEGDLPVIAVGSHDTASAVAATPLENRENSIYINLSFIFFIFFLCIALITVITGPQKDSLLDPSFSFEIKHLFVLNLHIKV